MAEEVTQAKLAEARKHFTNNNFADALKVLATCPQDDIKVKHNTAMLSYMVKGGSVADLVAVLESCPSSTDVDANTNKNNNNNNNIISVLHDPISEEFLYDGHEGAHYNRAVVLLHNGYVEKAVHILRSLVGCPAVDPEIQVRSAFVLQVATSSVFQVATRDAEDQKLLSKCTTSNMQLLTQNTALKQLFQMSFGDNSSLHFWFKDSEKTHTDRVTYFNNLGVLAMNDGKENLASFYFNNAMKEMTEMSHSHNNSNNNNNHADGQQASDASADLTHQSVYYNAGVCALLRKEYGAAVKALLLAQSSMMGSPLLWLRISQAALGVYGSYNQQAVTLAYAEGQNSIAADLCQHGRLLPSFQLLQLPGMLTVYGVNADEAEKTSLATAIRAINNGISLLVPPHLSMVAAAEQLISSDNKSLFRMLQYLLCYTAYVELQRMNYAVTVAIVSDLMSLVEKGHPLQPEVLVTLVIYASEALCHLNKPKAALKILQSIPPRDFIVLHGIEGQKIRVAAVMINLVLVHIANANWKAALTLTNNLISKFNGTPPAAVAATGGATTASSSTPTGSGVSNTFGGGFNQTATVGVVAGQSGGSLWLHIGRCATLLQIFIELAQGNRDRALEILSLQPVAPPIA